MKRLFIVSMVVALLGVIGCVFFHPNLEYRFLAQKMVTELSMPAGLVWLGLLLASISAYRQGARRSAALCLLLFTIQSLATNNVMSLYLVGTLERDFLKIQPLESKPLDALVLLGGGTGENAVGIPQLNRAGDRLAMAARLYHRGLTKRIYCTGKAMPLVRRTLMDPADQAEAILRDLGVPAESIFLLDGYNTKAEMESLSKQLDKDYKVGLVTSARHLKRAMRLANANGLNFVPIPSDVITPPKPQFKPLDAVPSAVAGLIIRDCLKEYLAEWFKR